MKNLGESMNFIKIIATILFMLSLVILSTTACTTSEEPSGNTTISITDNIGRVVHLDKTPERIISMAPSNTEMLFALGLADKIVGTTNYCNYPPEAADKETVGGFSTPDLEKILDLDPDLVFAGGMHEEEVVPELERRGLKVLIIAPETINDVLEVISLIGKATGAEDTASQLVNDIENRINVISNKVASFTDEDKPSVLYVTWHEPLYTLGQGTITHELIELAGGINLFADIEDHDQTNLEEVLDRNPEVILASTGHGDALDAPLEWANTEERLRETDARKNDRVYQVNADIVTRPGPRIVEGLEQIAELIHPELFPE